MSFDLHNTCIHKEGRSNSLYGDQAYQDLATCQLGYKSKARIFLARFRESVHQSYQIAENSIERITVVV